MATRVIFSQDSGRAAKSVVTVYSSVYDMVTPTVTNDGSGNLVGQGYDAGYYHGYQTYIIFNTTGLGAISSATFSPYLTTTGAGSNGRTFDARIYDWTAPLTVGQVPAGASLSGLPLVAYYTSPSNSLSINAYTDWTDDDLLANIGSSTTEILLVANDQVNNIAPIIDLQRITLGTASNGLNPKLTLVDASTQGSTTINTGTTSFVPTVTGMHDIESWGGGSRGVAATNQEVGGQGGSYGYAQINVTSLSTVTVEIAAEQTTNNTAGNPTWWVSSAATNPGASGGSATLGTATANAYTNLVEWDGGGGAAAQGGGGARGGSGGGSSAGTAAAGTVGTVGSSSTGGAGGTAPTGGGDGGAGGNSGVSGSNGTVPGGGPGGGGSSGGNAGNGAAGKMVVYWYEFPVLQSFPPFDRTRAVRHMLVR